MAGAGVLNENGNDERQAPRRQDGWGCGFGAVALMAHQRNKSVSEGWQGPVVVLLLGTLGQEGGYVFSLWLAFAPHASTGTGEMPPPRDCGD